MASTIGGSIPSLEFLFLVPNTDSFSVLLMELLTSINQSFLLSERWNACRFMVVILLCVDSFFRLI